MASFRILGLVSKNEIRSRILVLVSIMRVKIINLDLVSMPEIGGKFFLGLVSKPESKCQGILGLVSMNEIESEKLSFSSRDLKNDSR